MSTPDIGGLCLLAEAAQAEAALLSETEWTVPLLLDAARATSKIVTSRHST
ncbi:MAG: hypothetical protein ACO305_17650 [Rubrivivax sp.]